MERLPQPRAPGAWGRWGRLVGRTESFCCPFPVLLGVSLGPRDYFLAQLAFVPLPLLGSVAGSDFRHSLLRQHIGEDERWPWGEMRCSRAPDPGFQVPRSRLRRISLSPRQSSWYVPARGEPAAPLLPGVAAPALPPRVRRARLRSRQGTAPCAEWGGGPAARGGRVCCCLSGLGLIQKGRVQGASGTSRPRRDLRSWP